MAVASKGTLGLELLVGSDTRDMDTLATTDTRTITDTLRMDIQDTPLPILQRR